ncbi:Phytochrome-like protein cph1 [Acaryochloris thomasi RCC1774]|uniref:histidine kinase n=1 Tax=Acaryochloris thomasi RCC1774 TaxID=1764569 RepID=A0A2W1JMM6_9CYAN|nr:Phytochrome-like protein cph1 [Acaryochloris thomasi RCC1774]
MELSEANQALEEQIKVRELAEIERTKSQQRLQLALEGSGDGLWDWDITQDRIYFGPRYQVMLGYEVGELEGGLSVWKNLIHPEDRPWVIDKLRTHLEGDGFPYAFDYRVRMKSGKWKWIANFGKVVQHDDQGQPIRMTGTHRDISNRKQSELALRHKEAFLSSVYDGTEEGIFVIDVRGEHDFRFAGLNPTYEQLTGLRSFEIKGAVLDEVLCPAVAKSLKHRYIECIEMGETISYEETRFRNKQKVYWLTSLTPLFDSHSRVYRIIGTSIDITPRKRTEQQLQQAHDELASSNLELEQFAYVASHDLQEPLRKITSYSELLVRRHEGQFDEKSDKYLRYVAEGATRMQTLIRDLLAYSKVGRTGIEKGSTDLSIIMSQVTTDLGAVIEESHATLDIDRLPTVYVNSTLIRQLLQNLVGNALKYRTEVPPHVQVKADSTEDGWTFSIADNGIGIAPEFRERIFVVFQRLHHRNQYTGTGIGLSICKKIVEFHGGHIWLESEVGQGCTFYFTLPQEVLRQDACPHLATAMAH